MNKDNSVVAIYPSEDTTRVQEILDRTEPETLAHHPVQVFDWDEQQVGTYQRSVDTPDGEMLLIAREERLGGGTIVMPMADVKQDDKTGSWNLSYGVLSIEEAPPYSPNVDLHAYFEFWKRLGTDNFNRSKVDYQPAGSGPVPCDVEVPDNELQRQVEAALNHTADIYPHLITVTVNRGTVLLEGTQNDTVGRLKAAQTAASVAGVNEIVNMLVIRALL